MGGQRSPARGRPAHVGAPLLRRRLGLEPLDQILRSLSVVGRMTAVIETHAPDREKGLSIVALIVRMRGHLQLVYQVGPVVFQRLSERFGIPARNIVLDGKGPPGFPGAG